MENHQLVKSFLEWESDSLLTNYKYKDLPYWNFLRNRFYEIYIFKDTKLSGLNEIKYNIRRNETIKIIFHLLKSLFVFIFIANKIKKRQNFFLTYKSNNLRINNNVVNKFNYNIKKETKNKFLTLELSNLTSLNSNLSEIDNVINIDFIYLLEKLSFINKTKIESDLSIICISFINFYYSIYKEHINDQVLLDETNNIVFRNLKRMKCINFIYKILQPKRIVLYSSYSPLNILLQFYALKYNTEIEELQHSHIYSSHIGYLPPLSIKTEIYFPSRIYVFSNFYKNILENNNWNKNIVNIGNFIYNQNSIEKIIPNSNFKQIRKTLLIISQYSISKEISSFITNSLLASEVSFNIIIKLHPSLIDKQIQDYSIFANRNDIIIERERTLFELFPYVDGVAGVYSTGLIDAYNFGLRRIYVFNIKGSNFFDDLIHLDAFMLVNSIMEINMDEEKDSSNRIELFSEINNELIKKFF